MKKLFAIIMSAVLIVATCFTMAACNQSDKTLQVYTNAGFAPFEYVNTEGKVVGVDIDIMNKIGEELGYKVVINDIEFAAILSEVQNNKLSVGAAGMSKNDERDAVALSSIVYATSVQYVIAPNGTFANNATVTLAQLTAAANKIGTQAGTTGFYLIDDYLAENTALNNQVIKYSNAIVASQDIGSTLQAVIIDELPAKSIANANSNLSCWKIDADPESYVLYFNKGAADLVNDVNRVLQKMIDDGTIDQYIINHSSGR